MEKQEILLNIYNKLRVTGAVRSKQDFARQINYNYSCTSAAFNGAQRYLNDKFFTRILLGFPQVSEEYIRTGRGEILLTEGLEEQRGNTGINPITERRDLIASVDMEQLLATIHEQQEMTRRSQEQTEKALGQIDKLIEIIRSMSGEEQ